MASIADLLTKKVEQADEYYLNWENSQKINLNANAIKLYEDVIRHPLE